jgi:TonB-dependent receptor
MNKLRTSFYLLVSIAGPALFFANASLAQQTDDESIDEIVVEGVRTSLANALENKRASDLIVETISSDSIGQLPDVTIAESIVRLPGINGARDRGNESQAVVRGMGPRLVLGLVNGRETASTEPNRNVRWEIYPSEIVNAVSVYKSQSADLVSGGVAGTIDLRTVRPLDYDGPGVVMRGGPVYYEAAADIPGYSDWGYRGSLSLVGEVAPDFGVALAVTTQNQKNGFPSFQGWGYNDDRSGGLPGDVDGDGNPDYTPWGAQTEVKKLDVDRMGIVGALQWRPSDTFELNFDAVYSDFSINEDQNQAWYGGFGNWDGGDSWKYLDYEFDGQDIVAANINWGSVRNVIAKYTEDKDVFSSGLNAAWSGDDWQFDVDLSFSEGQRDNVWQAAYIEVYPEFMEWGMRDGQTPFVTTSMDPADPNIQFVADWLPGESAGPQSVTDDLNAIEADFEKDFSDDGFLQRFMAGARLSDRVKKQMRHAWTQSVPAGGLAIPADMLSSYEVKAFDVPPLLNGNFDEITEFLYGGFSDPGNSEDLGARWRVEEDVAEAYVRLDFSFGDRVSGNIGARYVDIDVASSGYEWVGGEPPVWNTIDHDYSEVLPSLNLNFYVNDEYILRFGVAKVMARPPLDEMNAVRNRDNPLTTPPPLTAWGGNPELDPFLAWQFDLSSEWYFADEALFAVAFYYKDVETHIGRFSTPITIDGDLYTLSGPSNGDGGKIKGVEVTFQTPFYFIPGLENFGIYSNYAYVDSDIEEFHPWWDPLTGAGLAKDTATVDLWYSSGGFEGRLGYKYHSDYSLIFGWDAWDVRTLIPETTLGLSLSYQVSDRLGLRLQANNLTNETLRNYRDNTPGRLGRYDEYGSSYLFDVTYRY